MPIKILMPALSPTMTEGNLVKWHKKENDHVEAGDLIAEIETDKATMEVEAVDEGVLGKIVVPEGTEGVQVNQVIAILLEEGEDMSALKDVEVSQPTTVTPEPQPSTESPEKQVKKFGKASSSAEIRTVGVGTRVLASPVAKRMAEHSNIDLQLISGSGPKGRIVKADVELALKKQPTMISGAPMGTLEAPFEDVPLTSIRKVIAQRLTESKQTVPHFYLTIECILDKLLRVRKELNQSLEEEGLKLSVNDFIIRAAALALRKVPQANASWQETHVRYYQRSDISVAVSIPDGLITPIIRGAEQKNMMTISREMKSLAERARNGQLKPEEFQGGTFSISNLGMYGIKQFDAVINPPQGCILAIGAGEKRPIVEGDDIRVATVMSCTLSVDHRAIDGVVGSEFLAAFKHYLTNPILMLAE